ncbi:sensor histidine kinase [Butyrivibrio sp. VCB2006]|uniref:sensor histidine kinase n=1 Tax=Butyrivibrio sp. VCB2006 TaxID=1280679 RepID=UPI00042685D2|nr:HAMP domain-containing sensor histidine kinase [Butyrivibrio sp. VCB2006]
MQLSNKLKKTLRFSQHILAGFIAFVLAYSISSSSIVITGADGDYSYNLYKSDRSRAYEESLLFNNILGNNAANVLRLVAERSQLETGAVFDGDKKVDVTAYVNRASMLPGDYITAVYYLSDILKWGQNGITVETRDFTSEQSAKFLSSSTTYTHLKNNNVSGGMNSYLNSQQDDNTLTFSVAGNGNYEAGSHDILISRYQTVDGKNIDDIVSNWDEYILLCSYIQETIGDLSANYKEYGSLLSYYTYQNSNVRYYVSRTVNGKKEIFTNVDELSKETVGVDVGEVFKGFGKYIYYCPYELKYDTNTKIKESVFRSLVKSYNYAFPDQTKIYLAVDTNNYPCSDDFAQGKSSFTKYMPYRTQLYILGVIAAAAYLAIFIILFNDARKAKAVDVSVQSLPQPSLEENILYSEAVLLLGALLIMLPLAVFIIASYIKGTSLVKMTQLQMFPYYLGVSAVIADVGLLYIIYEYTRRISGKLLWKNSFTRRVSFGARDLIVNTTDNGSVFIRTWIPYVIFVVINMMLFKIGIAGVVIAAFMDFLIGIYLYRQNTDRDRIIHVIENIKNGDVKAKVDVRDLHADNILLAEAVNSIGEGIERAVDTSMKDEKLKADLITNVSHDIKTPLTSIINYVGLIKRENIDNPKVKEYVEVLDVKSAKLKQLIEDLLEASKISSGNISIQMTKLNFVEMVNQNIGEFYEKFENAKLQPIFRSIQPNIQIMADPRHLWRVIENLFSNTCKYALPGTRVYMDLKLSEGADGKKKAVFSIKNISAKELDLDGDDLSERFIRGDESRTTEGSGLGLSIAKNLTLAQNGDFKIKLDGDLFKVILTFDAVED